MVTTNSSFSGVIDPLKMYEFGECLLDDVCFSRLGVVAKVMYSPHESHHFEDLGSIFPASCNAAAVKMQPFQ